MPIWYKVILGFVLLLSLAVPIAWFLGWPAMVGYFFGLIGMVVYLVYLLLFVEDADDSRR